MIKELINKMRNTLLIPIFLLVISMGLSMNDCYASNHSILRRGRYRVKLKIVFSDTTFESKIIKRMCKHYKLVVSYNHGSGKLLLEDRFKTIERICWYTYSLRIKITDMFNPDFKISEFNFKKSDNTKSTQFDEALL